jgi:hypothetical protein
LNLIDEHLLNVVLFPMLAAAIRGSLLTGGS